MMRRGGRGTSSIGGGFLLSFGDVGAAPAVHTPYAFPTPLGETGWESNTATLRATTIRQGSGKSLRGLDNVSDHGGKEDKKNNARSGPSEFHEDREKESIC
jgi:hypothetical protein